MHFKNLSKQKLAVSGRVTGLLILTALLMTSSLSMAQRLPSMSKAPWLGFFSGYEQRDFDMGVDDTGKLWIYIKKDKKQRIGSIRWIKTFIEISVEDENGKRSVKRLKDDEGFETTQKEGLDHDEVKFTAKTTGDAKIEVTVKYTRKGAILDGRILDGGELTKMGKLFLRFKVSVPAMYSHASYEGQDEKAKERMEDDEVRFVRAKDKKKVKVDTYIDVDLASEENAKEGVTELKVEMDGMEGKALQFSTEDKKGVFYFENSKPGVKGRLWKGYKVIWEKEMGSEKAKDAIKPFVIEVS